MRRMRSLITGRRCEAKKRLTQQLDASALISNRTSFTERCETNIRKRIQVLYPGETTACCLHASSVHACRRCSRLKGTKIQFRQDRMIPRNHQCRVACSRATFNTLGLTGLFFVYPTRACTLACSARPHTYIWHIKTGTGGDARPPRKGIISRCLCSTASRSQILPLQPMLSRFVISKFLIRRGGIL